MLSTDDAIKCQRTLTKLAHHINGPLILTGSLALDWHRSHKSVPTQKRPLNDIDLVVPDISVLSPSLGQDFLISHFHPTRGAGRILLQLVEETQRVRMDVFTPNSPALLTRVHRTEYLGIACGVVSAEDLTAKILAILYCVTAGEPVDPKYYRSFNVLVDLTDLNLVRELWAQYRKEDYPRNFDVAAESVHQKIANDPSVLRKDSYAQDVNESCLWCEKNGLFQASSRAKIFEVLGYV